MIKIVPFKLYESNPFSSFFVKTLEKKGVDFISLQEISSKLIKTNKINIIHFQWILNQPIFSNFSNSLKYFLKIFLLRLKGLKYCWTIHNIFPHENRRPILNYLISFLLTRLVSSLIVFSDWEKKEIKKKFCLNNKKIFIIPHGNYIGYYKNICSKKEARKKLNIPEKKFVYLFFGLIRRYKGVIDLIKTFKKIKTSNDILLIAGKIVGDDSLEKEIFDLKDDSIILSLNFIAGDEVQYYFNAADVVVLPFIKITNSGSLLLAMSFGKPVICKNVGSPSEIVKSNFGILYNGGMLGKAMVDVKKRDLIEMGKISYKEAKRYDWDEIAEKYKKVYEQVLRKDE